MTKFLVTMAAGFAALGVVAATTTSVIAFIAVTTALALAASLVFSVR
jgi:hypothetical protein